MVGIVGRVEPLLVGIVPCLSDAPLDLLSAGHSIELLKPSHSGLDFIGVVLEDGHGLIGVVFILGKVWSELFEVDSGEISSIKFNSTYR